MARLGVSALVASSVLFLGYCGGDDTPSDRTDDHPNKLKDNSPLVHAEHVTIDGHKYLCVQSVDPRGGLWCERAEDDEGVPLQ